MTNTKKVLLAVGAIALLGLVFALGSAGGYRTAVSEKADGLGAVQYDDMHFAGSVYNGISDVLMLRGGEVVGPVDTTTGTFSGDLRGFPVGTGVITTLSATSTAQTLTAAQVCTSKVVSWDNTTASSTLTLPDTANLAADCLTANGDTINFVYSNTSASTTVVTVVAGAGMNLVGSSASSDLIDNLNQAWITITRLSGTTSLVEVRETTPAD